MIVDTRLAAATVLRAAAAQIDAGIVTCVDTTVEHLLARHCGGGYQDTTDLGRQLPVDPSKAWEDTGNRIDAALRAVCSPALILLRPDWRAAAALRAAANHLDPS